MKKGFRESLPSQFGMEIAIGAIDHLRRLYAAPQEEGNRSSRLAHALKRVVAEKWRVHHWPAAFVEGLQEARFPTDGMAPLDQLVSDGLFEEALAVAAAMLPYRTRDETFLFTSIDVFRQTGAITFEAEALWELMKGSPSPVLEKRRNALLGQIKETEPEWMPETALATEPRSFVEENRILHLLKLSAPYRQSGYTMRSQYLIDGQRHLGLDPVAITAMGYPENINVTEFSPEDEIDGTTYYRLANPGQELSDTFASYIEAYASAAAPLVGRLRPSVIHAHSGHRGYESALVGMALAQKFDLPLVYEVRGFFESLWSRDRRWNERGEIYWRRIATENRCMRAAQAVVTLSETMRGEIISRGIAPEKVFVVPNGVDPEKFQPGPRDQELVDRLGLQGAFVFGYVSNLDHRREGQELLIEVISHMTRRGVPSKALIIGDGRRREFLEAMANDMGVADRVVFTGQVPHDQVLSYYRLLDVFVVPRISERAARLVSPLKPFEAMAAGIPLVVSDLPALSELVGASQRRGVTFHTGDSSSLADALVDLWGDAARRQAMLEAARTWVLSERKWSDLALRYSDVYAFAKI